MKMLLKKSTMFRVYDFISRIFDNFMFPCSLLKGPLSVSLVDGKVIIGDEGYIYNRYTGIRTLVINDEQINFCGDMCSTLSRTPTQVNTLAPSKPSMPIEASMPSQPSMPTSRPSAEIETSAQSKASIQSKSTTLGYYFNQFIGFLSNKCQISNQWL